MKKMDEIGQSYFHIINKFLDLFRIHVDHLPMLKYMEFVESLKINLHLFQQELINCIDIPGAREKVKSVIVLYGKLKYL